LTKTILLASTKSLCHRDFVDQSKHTVSLLGQSNHGNEAWAGQEQWLDLC